MKTVLSILAAGREADLGAAVDLSARDSAHLSVLALSVAPSPPIGEIASAATLTTVWLEARQEGEKALDGFVEQVEAEIARVGVSAHVTGSHAEIREIASEIARRARYADVILLGPALLGDEVLGSLVLDAALFESGTPVMILPAGGAATLSPNRTMVAWDSGHEAAQALKAAAALVDLSGDVRVVMVDPEGSERGQGEEPGADIAAYLARKGARVTVERLPSLGQPTQEVLRRHAADMNADLMVMGAYGHSRLRQRIFGGVTRSLTAEPPAPLLLAR